MNVKHVYKLAVVALVATAHIQASFQTSYYRERLRYAIQTAYTTCTQHPLIVSGIAGSAAACGLLYHCFHYTDDQLIEMANKLPLESCAIHVLAVGETLGIAPELYQDKPEYWHDQMIYVATTLTEEQLMEHAASITKVSSFCGVVPRMVIRVWFQMRDVRWLQEKIGSRLGLNVPHDIYKCSNDSLKAAYFRTWQFILMNQAVSSLRDELEKLQSLQACYKNNKKNYHVSDQDLELNSKDEYVIDSKCLRSYVLQKQLETHARYPYQSYIKILSTDLKDIRSKIDHYAVRFPSMIKDLVKLELVLSCLLDLFLNEDNYLQELRQIQADELKERALALKERKMREKIRLKREKMYSNPAVSQTVIVNN